MLKLLFICTHNRCRSILCEALARHLGPQRIDAYSAGSQPAGVVHPDTFKHLERRGIDTAGLRSESWDVYADQPWDAVVTVCDSAANEPCPLWLGRAVKVHWGLPDPSRIEGSERQRAAAFDDVISTIEDRITRLLKRNADDLSGGALAVELSKIAS